MNWATSELAHTALYESDALSRALFEIAIERLEQARELFHDLHDERGLAWVHVELAIAYGRMQESETDRKDERTSSLKSMYRCATIARSWSRRTGTDPIVAGFGDYLCAYSLLELTRSEVLVYETRERQLMELLRYAEAGQLAFRLTHRIAQAARCCQIKGEALYLLGQDQRPRALRLLSEAIRAQGEAVELLAEGFEFDERTLEAKFSDLNRALEQVLSRVAL
jgi:tetratricopeptide (TPR) repeat protein